MLDPNGAISEIATLADYADQVGGYTPAAVFTTPISTILTMGNYYSESKRNGTNSTSLFLDMATTGLSVAASKAGARGGRLGQVSSGWYNNMMFGVRKAYQNVQK